jgi:putative flippase GtrA
MVISRLKNYVVFATGGGVGALVNWGISFVLTSLIGVHYILSYLIAQSVNIVVNFTWHRLITFNVMDNSAGRFVRFCLLSIATALASIGLVYALKEWVVDHWYRVIVRGVDLNYLVVIIAVTFIISIVNFVISKLWIFNGKPADPCLETLTDVKPVV